MWQSISKAFLVLAATYVLSSVGEAMVGSIAMTWQKTLQQDEPNFFRIKYKAACQEPAGRCAEIEVTVEPLEKWSDEFSVKIGEREKLKFATSHLVAFLSSLNHTDILSSPLDVPTRNVAMISSTLESTDSHVTTVVEVNSKCLGTFMLIAPQHDYAEAEVTFEKLWREARLTSNCKVKLRVLP